MDTERTWAEIDLDCIEHNFREMKARLGEDTRFLGVVKADAYGHGASKVAAVLQEAGCDYFAVACLDEAMRLRAGGAMLPILILGYTSPERTQSRDGEGDVANCKVPRKIRKGASQGGQRDGTNGIHLPRRT